MPVSLATKIVDDFEQGRLSRRQLVARLMGLGAAMAAMKGTAWAQATEEATFRATGLDHIALDVTDVARSREFYVKHLGLRVLRGEGDDASFLGAERDSKRSPVALSLAELRFRLAGLYLSVTGN